MRVSVLACALGAVGALGGGYLIGRWCLGLMLILLSVTAVCYGLLREAGGKQPAEQAAVPQVHSLGDVLERARRAS